MTGGKKRLDFKDLLPIVLEFRVGLASLCPPYVFSSLVPQSSSLISFHTTHGGPFSSGGAHGRKKARVSEAR